MFIRVTLFALLLWGSTSKVSASVQLETIDIQPWSSSSVISVTPLTWNVSSEEELQSLFRLDDYQLLQYDNIEDAVPADGGWTDCAPCRPYYLNNTFQLHLNHDSQPLDFMVRFCDPSPPRCPDMNDLGYWKQVNDIEFPYKQSLPFSAKYTYNYNYYNYYSNYCSHLVHNAGYSFAILTKDQCYGADTLHYDLLMEGQTTYANQYAVKLMILTGCSEASCVQLPNTVCYCNSSSSPTDNDTAISTCAAMDSIVLPDIYLQTVLNYTDVQLDSVWVSDMSDNFSLACRNVSADAVSGGEHCSPNAADNSFFCVYQGAYPQFEWSEWNPYTTCDQACNGGTKSRKRLRFIPPVSGEEEYTPIVDNVERICNNVTCPWGNDSNDGENLYYKWAGCWLGIHSKFDDLDDHEVLDGDKRTRLDYIDKCAVAANIGLSDAFAIKKRLCHISVNLSSEAVYTDYPPSYDCTSLGVVGSAYDVYRLVQADTSPHWGPWSKFGSCSKACGGGVATRVRVCDNPPPPEHTTASCEGSHEDSMDCNIEACPADFEYESSACYYLDEGLDIAEDPLLDGYLPGGRQNAIRKCALYTYRQGYSTFGIVDEGDCVSYSGLWCDLRGLTISSECSGGMGGYSSIRVYGVPKEVLQEFCGTPSTSSTTLPATVTSTSTITSTSNETTTLPTTTTTTISTSTPTETTTISSVEEQATTTTITSSTTTPTITTTSSTGWPPSTATVSTTVPTVTTTPTVPTVTTKTTIPTVTTTTTVPTVTTTTTVPTVTITSSTKSSITTTTVLTLVPTETTTTAQSTTTTDISSSSSTTEEKEAADTFSFHNKAAELENMEVIDSGRATTELNALNTALTSTDDVLAATDILDVIADKIVVQTEEQAIELMAALVNVVDSLTQEKYVDTWRDSQNFTSILTSTETLSAKSAEVVEDSSWISAQKRVAMVMKSLPANTPHTLTEELQGIEVDLPLAAVTSASAENVAVAVVIYSNISEFIGQPILENGTVDNNSSVNVTNTVVSVKIGADGGHRELTENIQVRIPVDIQFDEETRKLTCAFWNETSSVWSTYGCTTARDNITGDVDCKCNHTTSYAILMSFTDVPHSRELTIVTYVGCAISLFFLITSFIIFVYLDNLRTDRKKIHMNLIVALGLSQLAFVVGVDFTEDAIACKCIAVLLHYLFLCTFCWMLSEGLHLYHKIVSVFETEGKLKKALYYIVGWGVPAVVVAISVGVNSDGYGSPDHCWLVEDNWMRAAFIAPAGAIIVINFCVMAVVIRIVVKSTSAVILQQQKKVQLVKAGVRSVLILTPLLGINWIFGLFGFGKAQETFHYLFVIINTLQGLLIFIFHCVGNAEVRNAFLRKREITSRSLDRSSDDKKTGLNKLTVWLFPTKKSTNWSPSILNKDSGIDNGSTKDVTNTVAASPDLVSNVLHGTVGRNLGGLKHMVSTPTPDEEELDSHSYVDRRPSTHFSTPARWNSADNGKFSISTASTTLEDSDYGSRHSDDEEGEGGMERERRESRELDFVSESRTNASSPSNYVRHGWSTSHDFLPIEINLRDSKDETPIDIEDLW